MKPETAAMADTLEGRKVLVMSPSSDGLRGPHRRAAVEAEALLLSAAIAGSLDRIPMFDRDGQPVLLIDGALRVVNAELLGWLLESHFTTPHIVQKAGRLELEYRGVRTNEMVLRHMLVTEEAKYGGLLPRLPPLVIERPQVMAAEEKPQEAMSNLPEVQVELAAGAAQVARHADAGARRELEMRRGAEVVAKYEGRQAAVYSTKSHKPAVIEEYPFFVPAESNAAEKPTDTQA
jgi:hypothetical protein